MRFRFRFRYLTSPGHTAVRLFCGPAEPVDATLGKCGSFVMRNEEWTAFKNAFIEGGPVAEIEFKDEEQRPETGHPMLCECSECM